MNSYLFLSGFLKTMKSIFNNVRLDGEISELTFPHLFIHSTGLTKESMGPRFQREADKARLKFFSQQPSILPAEKTTFSS